MSWFNALQAAVLLLVSSLQQAQQGGGADEAEQPTAPDADTAAAAGSLLQQWIMLRSPPLWMAAVELGMWNYLATASQVRSGCSPGTTIFAAIHHNRLPPSAWAQCVTCPQKQ